MTDGRSPDFDELVGGDLEPSERDRLRRVHDLLLEAGPPPELPPALEPRVEGGVVVPIRRASRRRMAVAVVLAAALAAVVFGAGVLVGGSGDQSAAPEPTYVVDMTGGGARASLAVFDADAAGNWPMRMTVQGLDEGTTYELWLVKDGKLEQMCGAFAAAGDGRTVVELSAPFPLKTFDSWVVTRAGDEQPILTQVAD